MQPMENSAEEVTDRIDTRSKAGEFAPSTTCSPIVVHWPTTVVRKGERGYAAAAYEAGPVLREMATIPFLTKTRARTYAAPGRKICRDTTRLVLPFDPPIGGGRWLLDGRRKPAHPCGRPRQVEIRVQQANPHAGTTRCRLRGQRHGRGHRGGHQSQDQGNKEPPPRSGARPRVIQAFGRQAFGGRAFGGTHRRPSHAPGRKPQCAEARQRCYTTPPSFPTQGAGGMTSRSRRWASRGA